MALKHILPAIALNGALLLGLSPKLVGAESPGKPGNLRGWRRTRATPWLSPGGWCRVLSTLEDNRLGGLLPAFGPNGPAGAPGGGVA